MTPAYQGIETRLLDGDLVNFRVQMTGAATPDDVTKYAQCAAAQYTLIRGYGFLRARTDKYGGEGRALVRRCCLYNLACASAWVQDN